MISHFLDSMFYSMSDSMSRCLFRGFQGPGSIARCPTTQPPVPKEVSACRASSSALQVMGSGSCPQWGLGTQKLCSVGNCWELLGDIHGVAPSKLWVLPSIYFCFACTWEWFKTRHPANGMVLRKNTIQIWIFTIRDGA